MKNMLNKLSFVAIGVMAASCAAGPDDTGVEYAPQMYHSVPYEPLSQVQSREVGTIIDSNPDDNHGEFYNSNDYNLHAMNMREPVKNTIKRGTYLPNHIPSDNYDLAAEQVKSPIEFTPDVIKEGKALYTRFCIHCHGEKGLGDGSVGKVFKGVTAYNSATVKDKPEGHIFHVITFGKGRMGAHASQISEDDRWKIVAFVQTLQKQ